MKKKLVFRTAKLLSDSRRLKTDAGVSVAYEHQPKDQSERAHGSLFAVIELSGPTNSSQEIAELIIDTLHREYYRDLEREPLESFEASLSKINEELADITEQGKIHWLGHLNAVLAVFTGNTLHITQSGTAEAYLFRKNIVSHVSKDLAGDSVNPLRTFINIASGEITEDDKVGLFSPNIFYHLSREELQKYITRFHPNIAVSHMANFLDGAGSQKKFSALVIEVLTPEALANNTIDDVPDEVWITEGRGNIEAVTDSASSVIMTAGQKSAGYLKIALDFIKNTFIPLLVENIQKVIGVSKSKVNAYRAKDENILKTAKEAISMDRYKDDDEVISGEDIRLTQKPERSSLVYSTFNNFSTGVKKTTTALKLPKVTKNNKAMIFGALSIIAVLLISFSIVGKIRARNEEAAKSSYGQAMDKYSDATNYFVLNEKEKGLSSLGEAKNLAQKVKDSGYLTAEADSLLSQINSKEEEASGIVKSEGQLLADLDKVQATGLLGLQLLNGMFYGINSNTGAVYAIDSSNGDITEVMKKYSFTGKPVAATQIEESDRIMILTDQPALYEFDPAEKEIFQLKIPEPFEKGNYMASFGTNIYILSPENDSINKHIKVVGGYSKKFGYVQKATSSNIKNGASMAIDGSIYVLSNDGQITKFLNGVQEEFAIKGLPQKPSEGSIIYANPDVKGLFILDKGKNSILVIDENYNFIKQIKNDSFTDLKGIHVDANDIYVLAGTKIYKISR